jgi:IS1 family transposase/lambda repressor-like predicted transcriptional regulator
MNVLTGDRRAQVIAALVEGNSIRSVSRMTGVARNTIMSLLVAAGAACAEYQDKALRNLPCKHVQCDEIWSFCYGKDKNLPEDKKGIFGYGSVWTWTALDADTKLICSWMVGNRDALAAREFIQDLAGRLGNRIQLTTDGHKAYLEAVDEAFGSGVDYAMLIKLYGEDLQGETRYSPAACIGTKTQVISGNPNQKHVSTSYVERQNLTMRMHMRRFTRLTNGFSKKIENHVAAISLHFMYYNFVRIHQTLRVTPAMAAGVTDRVWEISDIVRLLDDSGKVNYQDESHYGPALGHDPLGRRPRAQ